MASTTTATKTNMNWRRFAFYVIEIVYAIIAGTGEAYMYAAYNAPGTLRWWEAIARAIITQFAIIFFGVAGIEAMRWQGAARALGMLGSWTATIVASIITFWFLLDAARVFRDSAMLAPLNGASIPLPNGASVPNSVVDIVVVAALPFFQLGLNMLAPIITADHAPESLDAQRERQQREEAQAAHKARMLALKAQGIGAALGGATRMVKANLSGDVSVSNAPPDTINDTAESDTPRTANDSGPTTPANVVKLSKHGNWTTKELKAYALAQYGQTVSDSTARKAMFTLCNGVATGRSYSAPKAQVKRWVDETYSVSNPSEMQRA